MALLAKNPHGSCRKEKMKGDKYARFGSCSLCNDLRLDRGSRPNRGGDAARRWA
jgi:hypothetical protein